MRNIFQLTKPEQRIVIVIVMLLVVIAFAKHAWQTRSAQPIKIPAAETTAPQRPETDKSQD
jgi:hypothetical protein